jgi:hypothetical protein
MKQLTKLLVFAFVFTMQIANVHGQVLDLSGKWGFQLDPTYFETAFANSGAFKDLLHETVILPGTTDSNKRGILNTNRPINRLSRYYEYVGWCWYQRDIVVPREWEGKSIQLFLERILWVSTLYVDGDSAMTVQSFSTPHTYDLSKVLKPGKHRITIRVDNRVDAQYETWCHAFSEFTQTCWNGIIGKMELRIFNKVNIKDIQVYPDVNTKTAKVVCLIENLTGHEISGTINLSASGINSAKPHQVPGNVVQFTGSGSEIKTESLLEMGNDVQLWDEFSPNLYNLKAVVSAKTGTADASETKNVIFGMRNISTEGAQLKLNDRKIFLRGTLECGIFPLTGYTDMTVEGWLRICKTVKEYGLNHIRFHTWCPPEAAFVAADQTGVMLQVELPFWCEATKATDPTSIFFHKEMERILNTYGNHPSFILLCMGNELRGNWDIMASLVKFGKEKDPRHLYSGSTARKILPEDQFHIAYRNKEEVMTTYGARGPETDYDLSKVYSLLKIPGIAHEIGSRAVYPNFDEIKKYTGLLYPRNFEVFSDTLTKHGMIDQAKDFFNVSGNMTVFLYKESIEALLRTQNCGGFQMLDLHDFPGQGTSLVGILDPFWDSKGFISPEKFREFCNPTVPILRVVKREYFNTDIFTASAQLYHYGNKPLTNMDLTWDIKTTDQKTVASGKFKKQNIQVSTLTTLGDIKASLSNIISPQKLFVTVHVGKVIKNEWEIWVYPETPVVEEKNYIIARNMDEPTISALKKGKNVLMLPDVNNLIAEHCAFQNHFWSPVMFRRGPLTMGTLVKNQHPAFKYFPTEFYSNWQWWNIISNAVMMNLEGSPAGYRPLLQPIDTYDRCQKKGIIFEARVGKGKLLMACIDFEKDIANRPASQQLLYSLKQYVSGSDFNPAQSLPVDFFVKMFKLPLKK